MERVLGNHQAWAVIIGCNCNSNVNKSNHPIQNPLLLVTEPRTREISCVYVFACQSRCKTKAYLTHRSFYRKLSLCSAVFDLFSHKYFKSIHYGQKKRDKFECKGKFIIDWKIRIWSTRHTCWWGRRTFGNIGHPRPPIRPLNRGYTVFCPRTCRTVPPMETQSVCAVAQSCWK
jgi:hypothetical protein